MSADPRNRLPLVYDDATAQVQQLQPGEDMALPIEARLADLERRYRLLLADHVQKLGFVPGLADECTLALAQQGVV